MNLIRQIALVFVFFLFSLNSIGQYSDFCTWSAISLSKEIVKDLEADVEIGQRFKDNSMRYDRSLITGSLQYAFAGNFKIEGGYRYLLVSNDELVIESRYRLHTDLSWKYELGDISLRLKERIQYGFDDLSAIGESQKNKVLSRTKAGVDYSVFGMPLVLKGSYEQFVLLNDPDAIYSIAYRIKLGASYSLNTRMDIDLSYIMDQEINRVNPVCAHIVFLGLSYKL